MSETCSVCWMANYVADHCGRCACCPKTRLEKLTMWFADEVCRERWGLVSQPPGH